LAHPETSALLRHLDLVATLREAVDVQLGLDRHVQTLFPAPPWRGQRRLRVEAAIDRAGRGLTVWITATVLLMLTLLSFPGAYPDPEMQLALTPLRVAGHLAGFGTVVLAAFIVD
jgi:hypothetical protein